MSSHLGQASLSPADGLEAWGRESTLNELDAMMWRTEDAPADAWGGAVVLLLDRVPDWERVRTAHERLTRTVPRFRQKVVDPLLPIGRPSWTLDVHFELDYHLRRVALPGPGSERQLLDYVASLAMTPLSRNRPPWLSVLVEGLEGGRAAYVFRAMHILMDGGAATQLLSRVLTDDPRPSGAAVPEVPAPDGLTPLGATERELTRQARELPRVSRRLAYGAARALRSPGSVGSYLRSVVHVVKPPAPTQSPLLAPGRRESFRFGVVECEMSELKTAAKSVGGTLNDAFVCAVLGGLRKYHEAHSVDLDDVPMSMPVSVRKEGELGGSRFTGAFLSAPSSIADPAERMAAMRSRVAAVRAEPALDFLGALTPVLNRVPAAVAKSAMGAMTANTILMASSWPGVRELGYLAGAAVERMFTFGPLPRTRLSATMCTHVGVCCLAFNADGDVFPDADLLWTCMRSGLDEVLALGT